MKLLPNMKICETCNGQYPKRFDKCPKCHGDAKSELLVRTADQIAKATEIGLRRGDLDESQVKEV